MPNRWEEQGVEVVTFRYAPESYEVLGYGRSLEADERVKGGAALAAPLYALGLHRAVRCQLRARRFDLVHAHWIVPNGLIAAWSVDVPLAIGLHGSDVFLAEKIRPAAAWALRRSRLLTGCSPELVDRVRALGFPEERSRVIPYGVDVTAFSPDPDRRRIRREKLGIPVDAPLILSVGRMATKKGFHILMEALPELLVSNPEVHVVLAGGGDLLPRFQEEALRSSGWGGRLHLPGPVLRDTLPDLYRAADLFVLPAVHDSKGNVDGLPNVILEAMASGLPVVASGISGIPLAVKEGVTGLLVPEGEPAALLGALRRLLADPGQAKGMGERGRRKAETGLTWDAVAARYREGYLAALSMPL
jgi:glycosyltransferase involved in cell wall biosynthesis